MHKNISDIEQVWPVRVYYEDTDAGGVVYYANYLRYCERARTEWLRRCGIEQRVWMARYQQVFVVAAVEAKYRKAAMLDDALTVASSVQEIRAARLVFKHIIYRDTEVLFEALMTVACLDTQKERPVALPMVLKEKLLLS